jgi:uncharacterized protein involved in cysteine biosynthesis
MIDSAFKAFADMFSPPLRTVLYKAIGLALVVIVFIGILLQRLFASGLIIAAFVSIPIVNLATPLFAMTFMVHLYKRLLGPRPELIEPAR